MPPRRLVIIPVLALLTMTGPAALAAVPVPAAGGSAPAAAALRAPTVFSAQYPEGVWSPPRPGVLRFGAHGSPDVVQFRYSFRSDYPQQFVPAVDGAAHVPFTPASSGPTSLYVHSVDSAGNLSPVRRYEIEVTGHADALVARWRLDDAPGAAAVLDEVSGRPAVLDGDAHLQPASGRLLTQGDPADGSLGLDTVGDGAHTDGPLVDTSRAFTVLAWVRLPELTEQGGPATDRPVLSEDGAVRPGLWLGYDADALADDDPETRDGTFVLRMRTADSAGARVVQAQASREDLTDALGTAAINSNGYVSVAGVYDGAGRLTLFLNGRKAGTADGLRRDWAAPGPFRLGARRTDSGTLSSLGGDLDHVTVYAAALFDAEVAAAALEP